ncbi:site-specific DNA-methyltransferase [Flavobacterium sp. SUN052]|uniref:site-specific DNA-methyltransferase n=1 Tax=Flavobacterium sp. SUN052 TaxID=3002441 RepID=UPI00237D3D24|nr:site-specific DNA-methyltransferase [Flavobacterium sp. SUN052]MEC4005510.1 site-specific DNA-methyltransferase [Flavobacterium sp. SUN052]
MAIEQIKVGDELTISKDILQDNITKLKELFPELITENKIDFEAFKQVFGDEIETEEEYYRFTWAGKAKARREAHKPSTGTLRPAKEESVNWDTTENLYIEGDNLEVLKLLQKSYNNKVKMIYIDPPYNTGKDFVYKDNYKDNLKNYQQITGQIDDEGNKLTTNSESEGRYHSNWLNMMYPRLKLARNILKDDGVIFISIDDNENDNLRKICDEIFGESNFEAQIAWRRRHNQPNDKTKMIAKVSENILVYAKSSEVLKREKTYYGLPLSQSRIADYTNPDNDPRGGWTSNPWKAAIGRGGSSYALTTINGTVYNEVWYGNAESFEEHKVQGRVHWTDNGSGYPRIKVYLDEAVKSGQAAINFFTHDKFGHNQEGSAELQRLMNREGLFDNPKPMRLLKSLIKLATLQDDDIILDFFSGSAGLAQAVFELNEKEDTKRKLILVQLPENLDMSLNTADSTSRKTIENAIKFLDEIKKPHLLSELGKERIRRAGKKITNENPEKGKILDLGFKVFKLDSSNIKGWDGNPDNLEQSLFDSQDNIKTDRTEEDVLFEILLKYGLDLTLPIEEKMIEGKKVFNVGYGALFICLADGITNKVAEGIGTLKQEINPESCRVIFKDSGLTDVEKTNAVQTLKRFGIHEIKSI